MFPTLAKTVAAIAIDPDLPHGRWRKAMRAAALDAAAAAPDIDRRAPAGRHCAAPSFTSIPHLLLGENHRAIHSAPALRQIAANAARNPANCPRADRVPLPRKHGGWSRATACAYPNDQDAVRAYGSLPAGILALKRQIAALEGAGKIEALPEGIPDAIAKDSESILSRARRALAQLRSDFIRLHRIPARLVDFALSDEALRAAALRETPAVGTMVRRSGSGYLGFIRAIHPSGSFDIEFGGVLHRGYRREEFDIADPAISAAA